ncbi:hypothetical protein PanWU01x14_326020 [Parasponia andersonii]|uniref:Uncharacterized protein n=1 Tax=Parasponia andersonii TaxID=3476 RepID=A0A2P5AJR6_PARAD|nr:hypothetical protein PanWU01x14_326020 [Parasponia andersonii]
METQNFKAEQPKFQCQSNSKLVFESHQRRTANYKPSIWKYDFLESLNSKYDIKVLESKSIKDLPWAGLSPSD